MGRFWIEIAPLGITKRILDVLRLIGFVRAHCDNSKVHCPCRLCANRRVLPQSIVEDHIFTFGMLSTYVRWVFHGEPYDPPSEPGEAHLYHQDQVGEEDVDQLDQLTEAAPEHLDQLGEGKERKSASCMKRVSFLVLPLCR